MLDTGLRFNLRSQTRHKLVTKIYDLNLDFNNKIIVFCRAFFAQLHCQF